ncbi:hypothetical protein Pmani_015487 [Petrolisthes manimaculis]|uniref:Uncharacterized protein n=1 Tax=Petrolisthes manimaculis TaxID=1843537 RepID=A0AAE1UBJ5_9EUCA|nr:hypothetical protein Pmani_015487 [Petrolisthes manimaculis]
MRSPSVGHSENNVVSKYNYVTGGEGWQPESVHHQHGFRHHLQLTPPAAAAALPVVLVTTFLPLHVLSVVVKSEQNQQQQQPFTSPLSGVDGVGGFVSGVSRSDLGRAAWSPSSPDQDQNIPGIDEAQHEASQYNVASVKYPLTQSYGRSFFRRIEDYYYDALDSEYLTYILPALAITGLSLLFPNIVTGVMASINNNNHNSFIVLFTWWCCLLVALSLTTITTPAEAQGYDQYYYYHDQYQDQTYPEEYIEEEVEENESWFPSFLRWWVQPRRLWSRARSIVPRIADVAVESASAVVLPGLAVLALAMLWPEHKYIRSKRETDDLTTKNINHSNIEDLLHNLATVYSATVQSDQCLQKVACELGVSASSLTPRHQRILIRLIESAAPTKYNSLLEKFKGGVEAEEECQALVCDQLDVSNHNNDLV